MRVVSLIPSATEICIALGLGDDIVGRSHSCVPTPHSQVVTSTVVDASASAQTIHDQVSGAVHTHQPLYCIDEAKLAALKPELILTQELCSVCAVALPQLESAAAQAAVRGATVLALNPKQLGDVWREILRIAKAVGKEARGEQTVAQLRGRLEALRAPRVRPKVAFLEWTSPPMPPGHWTPDLIWFAGGDSVLGFPGHKTRPVGWQEVVDSKPDVLVVAPCGFSVEQTRREMDGLAANVEFESLPAVRNRRVFLIDGDRYFNNPGPELVTSAEVLNALLRDAPIPEAAKGKAERW